MSNPPGPLRLALCQMNATVGDIAGNEQKIREGIAAARGQQAQLVLFPELALTGYPPEDLLLKEHFLRDARAALERLAAEVTDVVALVGFPEREDDVYNSLAVLADGEVKAIYRKVYLPNYGVFDEQRYFATGEGGALIEVGGHRIGLTICEDIWEPGPPASDEAYGGASVIVNISASPFHAGKGLERERMLIQRARDTMCVVAFCALVGGQDELVFDGHSLVLDHRGEVLARAGQFTEELLVATVDPQAARTYRLRDARQRAAAKAARPVPTIATLELPPGPEPEGELRTGGTVAPLLEPTAEVYAALVTGLRDYVGKNGFRRVVLGLSGGIDSALVACVAADALGPDAVSVAVMPSPYSSSETQADARQLAANLGVELFEFDILPAMEAYTATLAETFAGRPADLTEENLQARIRGNLLMALSNKFGWLVLATGNKSEMSVGYSTLYGDLAGGFAVIKDCPKTRVFALSRHRNEVAIETTGEPLIPPSIIERPPSAELRPDQKDEDSLPPYAVLDPILDAYVEQDLGRDQLLLRGFRLKDVDRVLALVDHAEYKRRQAPPGIKITSRAFGRDRRVPITNRYRG
ncbi:NAD+ synthase [Conexibacter arvalis]|uniref:Glutamine-dependent NAD(+) synthetase n=1 Tax=Conexibacter arvalis TaxID=912552 RepID=A0A840IFI9_9ACTN|nr:NAD+ synthase [Conexibacter arvalis]MBB4663622.1 NAD+ synthase (glutamine-hydrolyzing) [Conexibacter arvalis]